MKRRTFLTLSGLALAAGVGGCVSDGSSEDTGEGDPGTASEPRQFQTDPRNTGHADGAVPGSATVDWRTTLDPIDGGLSVGPDRLVIAGGGDLTALDANDGADLWSVEVGVDTGLAPALTDDTAYVTVWNGGSHHDRGVAAIDLSDGSERWRAVPDVGVSSAPTLADGTLYVGGSVNSDEVIAVDTAEGRELWRFEAARHATTPAVADRTVYVGGGKAAVARAIDADTGEERWQIETAGEAMNPPTVAGGTVYVPTRNGQLHALGPDGDERWSVRIDPGNGGATPADGDDERSRRSSGDGSRIGASVAATGDHIYVPTDSGIVALSSDGTHAWTANVSTGYAPVVADGSLLVAAPEGVLCLDAADGEERWRHEVESRTMGDQVYAGVNCSPAVGDGTAFVAAHGGHVYALA